VLIYWFVLSLSVVGTILLTYRKYMVDVGMEKVYPVSEKVYLGEL
jgi:hypothetical protein